MVNHLLTRFRVKNREKESMVPNHPSVVFSCEIPAMKCLSCKGDMPFIRKEQVGPYQKQTYVCHRCRLQEHFFFDVRPSEAKLA